MDLPIPFIRLHHQTAQSVRAAKAVELLEDRANTARIARGPTSLYFAVESLSNKRVAEDKVERQL